MDLKDYLDQNGWSATQFASLTGLHHQTIINLLNGIKPRAKTAQKIKKITGKKVELEIFTRKKKKEKYEKIMDIVVDASDVPNGSQ